MTNRKTLILGQIPDDFSPEKHIPISPACFVGKEHIYSNWENLEFINKEPKNKEQLKEWDNITNNYLDKLVVKYARIFNEKFNLNYSDNFWFRILNTYLLSLIQITYYKQKQLLQIIDKYKHESIQVYLIKDNIEWSFSNTKEYFIATSDNQLFNEWICSRIIENILPPQWKTTYIDKRYLYKPTEKIQKENWKIRVKKFLFDKVLVGNQYIYGTSILDNILLGLLLFIKKPIQKSDIKTIHKTKTNSISELKLLFDIEKLITQTMPLSLKNCKTQIVKISQKKFRKGRINIGSQLLLFDDKLKTINALQSEHGGLTIGVQHGGHNYGSSKIMNGLANTEFINNIFFSWGYTEQEDYNNITPMPSPLLSKVANKHTQINNKIILVGTRVTACLKRYDGGFLNEYQKINYRKNKVCFIQNLNEACFNNFFYRPYFSDKDTFVDISYYKKHINDLKIYQSKGKYFHKEMLNLKLLVLDHPGTTLNLALAANVPTICFWDKDFFQISRQAIPYFEELEEAGILFSGENYALDAAKKVNNISGNVQEWWQQDNVQDAKNKWVNTYALTNKHWRRDWFKYLWKL